MIHRITSMMVLGLLVSTALGQETKRQYLSGKGIDDAVQWEFFCTGGAKSGSWTTIPVPSCWDVEGFGQLTYGRGDPVSNEQGKYRYRFSVPADWKDQKIYLVFEGAMTDTEASINGQSAGPVHQGAYYKFEYDVTDKIKLGQENLLEATVSKESSNQSVNRAERRADYWNYGGIFRPVYLEARPTQHIDRIAIDAKADGSFAMDAFTDGVATAQHIVAQIMDISGNGVGQAFSQTVADGKAHLTAKIDSPRQWTAETPNLYQVEVRLMNGDTVVHRYKQKFGFRTIEVRAGDGVYVNGQRIILKGTCRHSFWPESGRATSERLSRMDVALMKEMNNNAVRMSHYPPDDHFIEACDEMGLYVLDELAGWHAAYDTPTGTRLIGEMIRHDVNHPSILFWDNGNEGGWNREIDDEFAKWDPQQRHVLHPWDPFRDMDTKHYLDFNQTAQRANGPMVFMPTEFLHGMFDGGAGAGLEEYWVPMRTGKVAAGGFIWAYADESVKVKGTDKVNTAGNQAPDGLVGPYREKEGSFYTVKEIWSPVVLKRLSSGAVEVENRYDFTNTDKCTFTWELRKFNLPTDAKAGFSVLNEGKAAAAIAPHATGTLPLNLPPQMVEQADALAIRVNDPNGLEVWTYVWPLKTVPMVNVTTAAPGAKASENDSSVTLAVNDISATFDKKTGYLSSVKRGAQTFSFSNGPRIAGGTATFASLAHTDNTVTATYTGDLKSAKWTMLNDGSLQLEYTYSITGPRDFFGVSFDYPEANVKSKRWLGDGPYRVWRNRMLGGTLGVWENNYNNTMTGYSEFVYPEFKGYFADVRWLRLDTTEGPILVQVDTPGKFVQVLKPPFPGDPKVGQNPNNMLSGNAWAEFPDAGISILDAIPPIGSKFRGADSTGPMGQKPIGRGEYKGSIRLTFGGM
jgi:hypothetical protein